MAIIQAIITLYDCHDNAEISDAVKDSVFKTKAKDMTFKAKKLQEKWGQRQGQEMGPKAKTWDQKQAKELGPKPRPSKAQSQNQRHPKAGNTATITSIMAFSNVKS